MDELQLDLERTTRTDEDKKKALHARTATRVSQWSPKGRKVQILDVGLDDG